jgi:branched-chain amino acid transport system permease protein
LLAEQIVNGLVVGGMYALVALGFTLVFGLLDKLNFAHGEVVMVAGFVALVSLQFGLGVWLTLPIVLVVTGALGLLIELLSFRKFTSRDGHSVSALSSFALGIVFLEAIRLYFGAVPRNLDVDPSFYTAGVEVLGTRIPIVKLATLALSLVLMAGLHLFMARTRAGRSIRAVAEAPIPAMLLGINVTRVTQYVFVLASAMAGFAGLLVAAQTGIVNPEVGLTFALKGIAIMAIGGMGDLRGAVVAGLLVGVLEGVAFQFGLGAISDVLVWFVMIVVLLVKPTGLLGGGRGEARA